MERADDSSFLPGINLSSVDSNFLDISLRTLGDGQRTPLMYTSLFLFSLRRFSTFCRTIFHLSEVIWYFSNPQIFNLRSYWRFLLPMIRNAGT